MKNLEEKTVKSKQIYQGKILNLRKDRVELPDGKFSQREVVEHSGGVAVLAVVESGDILMVKQYRKPADKILLEVPAGKLEKEEDPAVCASRELREETGYEAGNIEKLFSFYTSPGYSDEELTLYLAENLKEVGIQPDPGEFLEVETISRDQILDFILEDRVGDSKTIIALLWYLRSDY